MISPQRRTERIRIDRVRDGTTRSRKDVVTSEEPLEIRLGLVEDEGPVERSVSVTMRTPGDDFDLAAGFLFTEGIVRSADEIREINYCQNVEEQHYNVVTVRLRDPSLFDPSLLNRNFYMTSSCGVCGKASLEAVEVQGCERLPDGSGRLDTDALMASVDRLRAEQAVFERTGGIHAAALFTFEGELVRLREDIGRHNAVDKVVGSRLLGGEGSNQDHFLLVSGRASFEIMQKAAVAGIPVVAAVGAPSSLAVDMARRFNQTLVGFLSADGFNVYSGKERLDPLP